MPGCGDTLIQGPRGTALTRNELRQHTVAYMGDKAFGKQVEAIATAHQVSLSRSQMDPKITIWVLDHPDPNHRERITFDRCRLISNIAHIYSHYLPCWRDGILFKACSSAKIVTNLAGFTQMCTGEGQQAPCAFVGIDNRVPKPVSWLEQPKQQLHTMEALRTQEVKKYRLAVEAYNKVERLLPPDQRRLIAEPHRHPGVQQATSNSVSASGLPQKASGATGGAGHRVVGTAGPRAVQAVTKPREMAATDRAQLKTGAARRPDEPPRLETNPPAQERGSNRQPLPAPPTAMPSGDRRLAARGTVMTDGPAATQTSAPAEGKRKRTDSPPPPTGAVGGLPRQDVVEKAKGAPSQVGRDHSSTDRPLIKKTRTSVGRVESHEAVSKGPSTAGHTVHSTLQSGSGSSSSRIYGQPAGDVAPVIPLDSPETLDPSSAPEQAPAVDVRARNQPPPTPKASGSDLLLIGRMFRGMGRTVWVAENIRAMLHDVIAVTGIPTTKNRFKADFFIVAPSDDSSYQTPDLDPIFQAMACGGKQGTRVIGYAWLLEMARRGRYVDIERYAIGEEGESV